MLALETAPEPAHAVSQRLPDYLAAAERLWTVRRRVAGAVSSRSSRARVASALLARRRRPRAPDAAAVHRPVNDFAHVIDADSARELDRRIRALAATTKDVVVVVTVDSFAPYGSIEEYAVKLFEQRRHRPEEPGQRRAHRLALKERRVQIEVGYGLEEYITDGFAGDTIRQAILPEFRAGRYGPGLLAGTTRVIQRIAEKRGVTLPDVPAAAPAASATSGPDSHRRDHHRHHHHAVDLRRTGGPPGFRRGGWGGPGLWMGGLGGFGRGGFGGGGFGGGFGGGGGGFGGFGGGGSGGGGASGGW